MGLFCRISSLLQGSFAKETYNLSILLRQNKMQTQLLHCKRNHYTTCAHTLTHTHMGWLRLVGSFKLQVSFAKEPYKRDYILPKRPIILRSLLIEATPYMKRFEPPKKNDLSPFKLQVSFAKEPYTRDYILPKRPIILRSLLTEATPYMKLSDFAMGWLWLVGLITLQVSFAKEPYKTDNILQKNPIIVYMKRFERLCYGVATISRLLKIMGLFCRISSLLRVARISRLLEIMGLFCRMSSLLQGFFAQETYHFKEPTNRSHPILKPTPKIQRRVRQRHPSQPEYVCHKHLYTHSGTIKLCAQEFSICVVQH